MKFWHRKRGDENYFAAQRRKIDAALASLPFQASPDGWENAGVFAVGGLEYVGFSDDSRYLLVISSSGRGVIDVCEGQWIARDETESGEWLDERYLTCRGIGPLNGQTIRIVGVGGGGLPSQTPCGDSLYLAALSFPCCDVIYQPNYQHCLIDGHNKDCVVIYRGFVDHCGFSWDGNTMAVINEDIRLWRRK